MGRVPRRLLDGDGRAKSHFRHGNKPLPPSGGKAGMAVESEVATADPAPPPQPSPWKPWKGEGASVRRGQRIRTAVSTAAKILVVDDTPRNVKLLADLLAVKGYDVITAASGAQALEQVRSTQPDLVLLDVVMPGMSGYEVCRRIRDDPATKMLPVVMVTALDPAEERIKGIEAGADDFLTKPINQPELLARVRSLLRIKALHDQVEESNRTLEQRVAEQVKQLERLSRLKRFFSPQLAELILSGGAEDPLKSHRREITVVFLDLRGFTAFAETAEPEEVMSVLREYHAEMGRIILAHEGTLERFTGDGMMVFFNDPVPVPDPAARAVRMVLAMQARLHALLAHWSKRGFELDFGAGIAQGYATIGAIGFEGRLDYGAIGTVTNLAARLCGEAQPGQILISKRVLASVEELVDAEPVGALTLKGFGKPVPVFNVTRLKV
jgi:adenylate cyclase